MALVFVLSFCKRENIDNLNVAEQIIEHYPDSALKIINDINDPSMLSKDDLNRFSLLKVQAMDKCYMDITSDSLIDKAAKYFLLKKDSVRAGKALFYCARIADDLNLHNKSTSYYLKAEALLENTEEYKYKYMVANYLGLSFYNQSKYNDGLKVWFKALERAKEAGNENYETISLINIGTGYLFKMAVNITERGLKSLKFDRIALTESESSDCDNAIVYFRKAYNKGDISSYIETRERLAQAYMFKQMHDSAFYYSDLAINIIKEQGGDLNSVLIDRAAIYNNENNPDEALKILYSINDDHLYVRMATSYAKIISYELKHQQDSISKYLYLFNSVKEEHRKLEKKSVGYTIDMIEKYHRSESENINLLINENIKRKTFTIVTLLLVFTTVILILLFYGYKIRKEKENALLLNDILREKEERAVEQMKVSAKMNEFFALRNRYSKVLLKYFIGINTTEGISDIMINEDHWNKIITTVSETYNDLPRKLSQKYKKLTNEDVRIFCLLLLKLKQEDIAKLTGRTPGTISLRLSRMKDKMELPKEAEWGIIIEEILTEFIDVNPM